MGIKKFKPTSPGRRNMSVNTKEVVTAAVSVGRVGARRPYWLCLLRQAWKRIKLSQDSDHRLALAHRGGERRGDPDNASLHRKAGLFHHPA